MKCVMLSIRPKYCELIASGKKTVEVRRTKPKIDVPFKCYIYCTEKDYDKIFCVDKFMHKVFLDSNGKQKVIGEFVCDKVVQFENDCYTPAFEETSDLSCVGYEGLYDYLGAKEYGYGWHITDLVIYDKPKELSEFYQKCKSYDKDEWDIDNLDCIDCENPCGNGGKLYLKRPPQSWCYCEELKGATE